MQRRWVRVILSLWLSVSTLMLIVNAIQWYGQQAYLRGFAEAIVPLEASPVSKVKILLKFFSHHPKRLNESGNGNWEDPIAVLRHEPLLKNCGSASLAFVNLARVSGIPARGLLLLNREGIVHHVVAEVYLNGRWVVVDPSFGLLFQDSEGQLLTKEEVRNRKILKEATASVDYPSEYTFERTTYINWAKIPLVGRSIGQWMERFGLSERIGRPLILDNAILARLLFWIINFILAGISLTKMLWLLSRRQATAASSS